MTEWKQVQGTQPKKPAEWDTISSPTTVYQRRNIKQVTLEKNGGSVTVWQYDERQMTQSEMLVARMEQLEQGQLDIMAGLADIYGGTE